MDGHNVHQFWGVSSAIDLLGTPGLPPAPDGQPLELLQICPYDPRHSLATLGTWAAQRDSLPGLQLHVYEEHPEALARHILLLYVLLDHSMPPRERCEVLLELHGNALLRPKTMDYLGAASKLLEDALVDAAYQGNGCNNGPLSSSSSTTTTTTTTSAATTGTKLPLAPPAQAAAVMRMFDLRCLKHRDMDDLAEVFRSYRAKRGFDMVKAWDTRSRHWYAERYDTRRNMIDWDYHMRLMSAGTPGLDPSLGSIVHYHHFRHWRLTGVAYELRDCTYSCPNTTLLSTAHGRTKEFKDRDGKDVGRSVAAAGYWGNLVDAPHLSFGISSQDPALLKQSNKQFTHTSMDVAEHNMLVILRTLRGEQGDSSSGGGGSSSSSSSEEAAPASSTHRARAARGPTDMAGLQEASAAVAAAGAGDAAAPEQMSGSSSSSSSSSTGPAAAAAAEAEVAAADGGRASLPGLQGGCGSLAAQEAEQRAASAALDVAALDLLLSGVRFVLHTGDVHKALLGQRRFAGRFRLVTLGHRHVHLLGGGESPGARCVCCAGGAVLAETGQYLLVLNKDKAAVFKDKIRGLAAAAGLQEVAEAQAASTAPRQLPPPPPQQQQQEQQKQQASEEQERCGGAAQEGGDDLRGKRSCVVEEEVVEDGACTKDQTAAAGSGNGSSGGSGAPRWHMGWYGQLPDAHLLLRNPCAV